MHITNQIKFWYIYGRKFTKYLHGTWSLLNILMIFGKWRKMYNFDPYSVLLAIATNIPVLLMTAFVLQGHKYINNILLSFIVHVLCCIAYSYFFYYSFFIFEPEENSLCLMHFTAQAVISEHFTSIYPKHPLCALIITLKTVQSRNWALDIS